MRVLLIMCLLIRLSSIRFLNHTFGGATCWACAGLATSDLWQAQVDVVSFWRLLAHLFHNWAGLVTTHQGHDALISMSNSVPRVSIYPLYCL
ncbi:hypothetical protein AN477_12370 [Alicyclobacillus ferrooxydans]|uniref:Secreted protein n=1 Tax=Alicyclobacillus ferrooxydans TaxID=471514 RepID=A0A0P9GR57_9BACL|nr:hypothetical protein AN477_12370 [Alicyclobacillus ferrooxydans]